jgi:hypothetical protein
VVADRSDLVTLGVPIIGVVAGIRTDAYSTSGPVDTTALSIL